EPARGGRYMPQAAPIKTISSPSAGGQQGHAGHRGTINTPAGQAEFERGPNYAHSVHRAAPEIDRRGFREVSRRARDFADARARKDRLREDLIVENEIVRVAI